MSAQEEFDKIYITSSEICHTLGISRTTVVHGRRRGMLPDPIQVNGTGLLIWKRDTIKPYLDAWVISLQSRRGELVS